MADRIVELQGLYARLGNGARGAVFECMINGQPAALKVYFEETFFHKERLAYEKICHNNLDGEIAPRYIGQVHLTRNDHHIIWSDIPRFQANPHIYSFDIYPHHTAIAMELLTGVTLYQASMRNIGDEQIKMITAELSTRLVTLHDVVGICHRDLSWNNAMIDKSFNLLSDTEVIPGQVRIVDFSEALFSSACSKKHFLDRCLNEMTNLGALVQLVADARPYYGEHEGQKLLFGVMEEEEEKKKEKNFKSAGDTDDKIDSDDEVEDNDEEVGDEETEDDDDLNRPAEHSYMSDDEMY